MRRLFYYFVFILFCLKFISCSTASPEKYFDIAVLNSNMVVGFAGDRFIYELENPSVKLDSSGGTSQMKRVEIVSSKIEFTEGVLKKLKGMRETDDTKDILRASISMYELILPVYKGDYIQLAKLYDQTAPKEAIQLAAQAIHDKYYPRFDEFYSKLIEYGKAYAKKHDIKVNWAM